LKRDSIPLYVSATSLLSLGTGLRGEPTDGIGLNKGRQFVFIGFELLSHEAFKLRIPLKIVSIVGWQLLQECITLLGKQGLQCKQLVDIEWD
jgi:hypothetical protein